MVPKQVAAETPSISGSGGIIPTGWALRDYVSSALGLIPDLLYLVVSDIKLRKLPMYLGSYWIDNRDSKDRLTSIMLLHFTQPIYAAKG